MQHNQFEFIIVGQGIAGSILAFQLIKSGKKVMVIDNHHAQSSSRVAAGIINPITGHRINISEGFEDYFRLAVNFYNELRSELSHKFIETTPQMRLLKNASQRSFYQQRLKQAEYAQLLGNWHAENQQFKPSPHGVIEVFNTAMVDTNALLDKVKDWLLANNAYLQTKLEYAAIEWHSNGLSLGELSAQKIIFCEGHQARFNPWLANLPFKLAKGEVITLELDAAEPRQMLNWGQWLAPFGISQAKLGSNFCWNDLDLTPDPVTRQKLLDSLASHTNIQATPVATQVGIRPTTLRRTPFVGGISGLDNAYCFNGFGSKGCLTIPYHAKLLCEHLLQQRELPENLTESL